MNTVKLILASQSPRRLELLIQIGYAPFVLPADVDEHISESDPGRLVEKLSQMKAQAVADRVRPFVCGAMGTADKAAQSAAPGSDPCTTDGEGADPSAAPEGLISFLEEAAREGAEVLVLGSDTIVWNRGKALGKPRDTKDAEDMIRGLSGHTHEVYTGVTLVRPADGEVRTFHVATQVEVAALSEEEVLAYAHTREPMDKAGGYAIQGSFARHITGIRGDYSNVVGLPLPRLYEELKKLS